MARESGTCGSTLAVRATLRRAGLSIESLGDCRGVQSDLEASLERLMSEAELAVSDHLQAEEARLARLQETTGQVVAQREAKVNQAKARAGEVLAAAQTGGLLGRVAGTVWGTGLSIGAGWKEKRAKKAKDATYAWLAKERSKVEQVRDDPEVWLAKQREDQKRLLDEIRSARGSPEFGGAVGEEVVAHRLRGLDDRFAVLHDVHIELAAPVALLGLRARRAQIDHVVVGPSGVFAIETKNWSAAEPSPHSPTTPTSALKTG